MLVYETEITAVGILHTDHVAPLYLQKLALTSLTSGCRSVGIVRSRTQTTEFKEMDMKAVQFSLDITQISRGETFITRRICETDICEYST
jgi:hypothetical protein